MKDKKVALVLSGGAALGFAHLGVIKVLEKYGGLKRILFAKKIR